MSLILPIEQLAASAIAGLIITGGQKGSAAAIVKRANSALAVSAAISQIASGNAAQGVQAIQSALTSADLDPGVAIAVQGLFAIGAQQIAAAQALGNLAPLFGATAEAMIANITAGVTAAANAEIAKYGSAPSVTAPVAPAK